MIVLVHVPFSELANAQVAFKRLGMTSRLYGIWGSDLTFLVQTDTHDEGMQTLVKITEKSKVRFSFHNDYGSSNGVAAIYKTDFGDDELEMTHRFTPEYLGVTKKRLVRNVK